MWLACQGSREEPPVKQERTGSKQWIEQQATPPRSLLSSGRAPSIALMVERLRGDSCDWSRGRQAISTLPSRRNPANARLPKKQNYQINVAPPSRRTNSNADGAGCQRRAPLKKRVEACNDHASLFQHSAFANRRRFSWSRFVVGVHKRPAPRLSNFCLFISNTTFPFHIYLTQSTQHDFQPVRRNH